MGRPRLARCGRGHDTTDPDSRYAGNGMCRQCSKDHAERRRRASGVHPRPVWTGPAPRSEPRISPQPLFDYIAADSRITSWTDAFSESDQRLLYRWRHAESVPLMRMDDFIVTELGVHPVAVYGWDWYAADVEVPA